MTSKLKPDPKAVALAGMIHQQEQPELTILFGSRARGDYQDKWSDIDIMLVQSEELTPEQKESAERKARESAEARYRRPVKVQLIWRTMAEFRFNRRYCNSLETEAIHDGVIMPRNPEDYGSSRYEDEQTEYSYSWTNYDLLIRDAENHLSAFELCATNNIDDKIIGQQAQRSIECGMKALLEALKAPYKYNHNIGDLLGTIRHFDPEMADFRLSIPPQVYSTYEGNQRYAPRIETKLTEFPDFFADTINAAWYLINRARAVREQQEE